MPSQSTMSNAASPLPSLYSLVTQGKTLADILKKAKSNQQENICNQVDCEINLLLRTFGWDPCSPNKVEEETMAIFPKEATVKFLKRIQHILQEFIELDDQGRSTYQDAATNVNNLKILWQSGFLSAGDTSDQSSAFIYSQEDLDRLEKAYRSLTSEQKQCLLCFLMFPACAEIKKRELTHLWIGLDLVTRSSVDERLEQLMKMGFIQRVTRNSRLLSRYTMSDSVQSKMLTLQASSSSGNHSQGGCWSVMLGTQGAQPCVRSVDLLATNNPNQDEEIQAVFNVNDNTLDDEIFDLILRMRNVKVLCLGNWQNDPNKYIVVEDMEGLGNLKNLAHVKVLSLEGISGLVKLPGLVCQLTSLKVLDLRACPNLELLPEGIGSLINLTHLDLSECYLLDHIPKGITSLICLQELKGFVFTARYSDDSICGIQDLEALKQLRKLTVRYRGRHMDLTDMTYFVYLQNLSMLKYLSVTWVGVGHSIDRSRYNFSGATNVSTISTGIWETFLPTLRKLDLRAPPGNFRLGLGNKFVEKLYIRGGGFPQVTLPLENVKLIRLRHLHSLKITWDKFRAYFPNLARLEVFDCPQLRFPCDNDGIWTKTTVTDT